MMNKICHIGLYLYNVLYNISNLVVLDIIYHVG